MDKKDTVHVEPDGETQLSAQDWALISLLHRAQQMPGPRRAGSGQPRTVDIGAIAGQLPGILAMIQQLLAFYQAVKPAPKPQPPPAPTPVPVPPNPFPTPAPTPGPAPVDSNARRIEHGSVHIIGLEKWNGKPNGHSPGNPNVAPYGAGYRVHMDATPVDQHGVPFSNDDLPRQPEIFGLDPAGLSQTKWGAWTMGEGNNRIEHYIEVDGKVYGPQGDTSDGTPWEGQPYMALTSETDDAAMTPVLLVNYDAPLDREVKVRYRAVYVAPDGRKVDFGWSRVMPVHPWGF